ncbi:MAG: MFS transporter [Alphaproteobacteria bacterium]|nr:MFS transporter [Alphaproteobacteria bacterium]
MGDAELERRTMGKVMWRLLPLMMLMFLINQLDRVNVSFAALTMNRDIGLDTLSYAWGAGIFFLSYFAFEIPSNLILERVGARLWIARIMITWGIISGATMFVTGPASFLTLRFLLGAAEAGFVPGLVLYITWWFPPRYRARATAWFFFAAPLGNAVSGILSVPLLRLNGIAGLTGWQWMFLVEAIPALLMGVYVLRYMKDRPSEASWLTAPERGWLDQHVDRRAVQHAVRDELGAICNRRVSLLSAIYLFRAMSMYGVSLFLPLILSGAGLSNTQVGFTATIPFLTAAIGAVIWAWSSDRSGERHWHTIAAMLVSATGLATSAWLGASVWSLIAISIAAIGLYAQAVCFWSIPPMILGPAAAATGFAAINAIGNLGGFLGPYVVGATARGHGDFSLGLYAMAGCALLSAVLSHILMHRKWEKTAQRSPA